MHKQRIGPVLGREALTVGPPDDFISDVYSFALYEGLIDPAVFHGIRLSTWPCVVNQRMHILAQQIFIAFVAQHVHAGRIGERAVACEVDAVDPLAGGVEQSADQLLVMPMGASLGSRLDRV